MSTRLSVSVAWFPVLEIKTGTANKNRNYHKVLAFFLEKLVDIDGFSDFLYPPQNEVLGGYTVFSLSVIPSFCHSVIP